MPWKRPASVPVPQVWMRFQGRERDGRPAQMYQIRDMEEERRQECLDFMVEQFLRDEPLCNVFGIPSDLASISTIRANWERFADDHVCLACYTDVNGRPDQVVGFSILYVRSRDDVEPDFREVKGEPWKKLLKILLDTEGLMDVFDHYGVDQYLSDSGMAVCKNHRGQRIGGKMLEARKPLVQSLGLEAISTVFTAKHTQILAKKIGYELLGSIPYKEILVGEDMSHIDTPCVELRGIKYSLRDYTG